MNGPDYKTGKCIKQGCTCNKFVKHSVSPGALKPCSCGHSKNKHRGHMKHCVQCTQCNGYEERVAPAKTTGNTSWEGEVVKWGDKWQPKQLPLGTRDNGAYQYPAAYSHPKVCLCGHLLSTHIYGTLNQCKLCVCDRFDDADNHPGADVMAYTLEPRVSLRGNPRGAKGIRIVDHKLGTSQSFEDWKRDNVVDGEVVRLRDDQDVENLVKSLLNTVGTDEVEEGDYSE